MKLELYASEGVEIQDHLRIYVQVRNYLTAKCRDEVEWTTSKCHGEQHISSILKDTVNPSYLEVRDISGGCGSMYEILIQSDNFKGKSIIQQHRMVKEALAEEIKNMHGLTIRTSVPK
ncbi:uncharacterized protein TRIADDRAFT_60160 [Trichoplax adhaerens]|uniref:BolA-like protein 3 n=1 Tax=Trichoplax adhaerens TaxID=10228 RepID=B3S7G9_TRIAD|nr:hypothetical protein TRIADDRAFT_60160 [Trichoplax adhaerens]EDV21197.1 hypothetical protein TRIADDRAFT_60160 [Trichoplax adhaerens]|eukprot:XP_002116164.1 hypothetical protein TRIADDRAFT_60160 [Trichoplax adhaerens]